MASLSEIATGLMRANVQSDLGKVKGAQSNQTERLWAARNDPCRKFVIDYAFRNVANRAE
jgi:hypothetical protein